MKNKLFALIGVFILLTAGSAWGQARSFQANVPFSFSVGQQIFPAGHYQFQSLLGKPGRNSELGMIAIRDLDGRHLYKVVLTGLVHAREDWQSKSKLVFGMNGGVSYLSHVWIAGDSLHRMPGVSRSMDAAVGGGATEIMLADLR
jgi:hypothetical protein